MRTDTCGFVMAPIYRSNSDYGMSRVVAIALMLVVAVAAHAQPASDVANEVIFADGFDVDFTAELQASVSIRQGGVVSLPIHVIGSGFTQGAFDLFAPTALNLSTSARLYAAGSSQIGYSFEGVSDQHGNLTLYVGRDMPIGVHPLTVIVTASGATHTTAFTLQVLPKGNVVEIWPTDPSGYEDNLGDLQPGDVLVLHEGTYPGYKTLYVSGTREMPITIRGYGQGEAKPVLAYTGNSHNHWEIRGSNLIVQGLEFDTSDTYSIRIRPPASNEVENVSLINNDFVSCGGGCVSANDSGAIYADIRIIDSLILDALKTPVYIGNHSGTATFHNFLFEGNVIDGRSISGSDVVGYGIEVKLNVENAVLRNNYIVGTRGPGIMTYGLERDLPLSHRSVVRSNIVIDACEARSILFGAGPVVAQHNLAMGGHFTGYGISDYGNRHLSYGVEVIGNTALLNEPYGFWIHPNPAVAGLADLKMFNNLAYPSTGGQAYANLPPDSGIIHDNDSASPTTAMSSRLEPLRSIIPSPQDLKPTWPLLSQGPLDAAALTDLLNVLASLPSQSSNAAARVCP